MTPRHPQRSSGRPRGADSAARRTEILDAAEELFSEDGYRGVSMSMIARAAGISQTGLVHHFPTKDDLLGAVLDRRDERDSLQTNLGGSLRGWDLIRAFVDLARHNEAQPTIVRLYASVSGEAVTESHPASAWLLRHHAATRRLLEDAVHQAVDDGDLQPEAPAASIARLLVAAMDGLQVQWLSDPQYTAMAEDFAALTDALYARWRR